VFRDVINVVAEFMVSPTAAWRCARPLVLRSRIYVGAGKKREDAQEAACFLSLSVLRIIPSNKCELEHEHEHDLTSSTDYCPEPEHRTLTGSVTPIVYLQGCDMIYGATSKTRDTSRIRHTHAHFKPASV
jgi:hypothetical protein